MGTQLRRAAYFSLCLAILVAGISVAVGFSLVPLTVANPVTLRLIPGGFLMIGLAVYGLWYDFLAPWLNAHAGTDFEDDFGQRPSSVQLGIGHRRRRRPRQ